MMKNKMLRCVTAAVLGACVFAFSGCGNNAAESGEDVHQQFEQILTIDITEDGMSINGAVVGIPVEMDTLTDLLGEPRAVEYETDLSEVADYMLEEFPEMAIKRINYAWDELGIYCYTREGEPVNCIGILSNPRLKLEHYPENSFEGELTINGSPWYEVMRSGDDLEVLRSVTLGKYSLVSSHADYSAIEATGTAADYESLEFQLG